jgi:putative membrane protein
MEMIANRTYSRGFIFLATALLAALLGEVPVLAQITPGTPGQAQPTPGQAPGTQPGQQPNSALDGPASSPEASFSDRAFVSSMLDSDAAEVQLGQLAQQKSQSADIKQLGQKMQENRNLLDQQLKPLAQKLEVTASGKPSKKTRQLVAKLETLSGAEFDQEYIRAVVKDNQQAVKDLQNEAQTSQDPNLQLAAKQDAGVLAQHLQTVEQIAQSHNVAIDTKK